MANLSGLRQKWNIAEERKKAHIAVGLSLFGSPTWTRTRGTRIKIPHKILIYLIKFRHRSHVVVSFRQYSHRRAFRTKDKKASLSNNF